MSSVVLKSSLINLFLLLLTQSKYITGLEQKYNFIYISKKAHKFNYNQSELIYRYKNSRSCFCNSI